jgi:GMP synthase (glutamine-hydrolysing)
MILIISTCSEKLSEEEFVKPIASIVKKDYIIKHYRKIGVQEIKKFDKIIICGTAIKDNKYLREIKKFDWIKNINKPILGICAGMQIIGLIFKAKLIKNDEIGMTRIITKKANKLFSDDFEAYELHEKGLSNLKNFEILALSDNSVQAIKHKRKEIYGIMFHPEVRNERVVENFVQLN